MSVSTEPILSESDLLVGDLVAEHLDTAKLAPWAPRGAPIRASEYNDSSDGTCYTPDSSDGSCYTPSDSSDGSCYTPSDSSDGSCYTPDTTSDPSCSDSSDGSCSTGDTSAQLCPKTMDEDCTRTWQKGCGNEPNQETGAWVCYTPDTTSDPACNDSSDGSCYTPDTTTDPSCANDSSDGSCYTPDTTSDPSCVEQTMSPIECGTDTGSYPCEPETFDNCPA